MRFVEVADGVLVRTSRRMGTTTTLALGPGGAHGLLVDPSWDPDELEAIADDLDALGVRVTAGLATHAHHDHLLWHPRYGTDVIRWASGRTATIATERRDELLAELAPDAPASYPDAVRTLFGRVTPLPGADTRRRIPGPAGTLPEHEIVVHDAHAPGHAALWLPGPRVLVAGDMLSDAEIPLPFDPDDVAAYLAGLDRLEPWVRAASVLVPGHGTPSDRPLERLDADRRYLDAVLAGRDPEDPRLGNPGMAEEHAHVLRIVRKAGAAG